MVDRYDLYGMPLVVGENPFMDPSIPKDARDRFAKMFLNSLYGTKCGDGMNTYQITMFECGGKVTLLVTKTSHNGIVKATRIINDGEAIELFNKITKGEK